MFSATIAHVKYVVRPLVRTQRSYDNWPTWLTRERRNLIPPRRGLFPLYCQDGAFNGVPHGMPSAPPVVEFAC